MGFSSSALISAFQLALLSTALQALFVAVALVLPALALSRIERLSRNMLTATFGFRAILWTGWIGVPVHELSHYIACLIFRHRVDSISLFSPDPRTGTLGYVNHSWDGDSLYQRSGNFFIGIAPIAGGLVTMVLLLVLVLPEPGIVTSGSADVQRLLTNPGGATALAVLARFALDIPASLLDAETLLSWRTWLALYLIMSIGLHMNPSREDMKGTAVAALWAVMAILVLNLVASPFGGIPEALLGITASLISPVTSGLLLAVLMNLGSLAGVMALTGLVRVARSR